MRIQIRIQPFQFNADQDPASKTDANPEPDLAFHFNAAPDPASKNNVDPDPGVWIRNPDK